MRSMEVGLFGGSFNPIHNGHLHLAESALRELHLDRVMLMPAGEAPHKDTSAYAPAMHRYQMCCLAAAPLEWLSVSDYEIRKKGKNYTVETLRHLTRACPQTRWTLLIGSDMLLSFDKWFRWQEILETARLAAVSRETGDLPELCAKAEQLMQAVPGAEILVLSAPAQPLSSTQVRGNLQKGADCSCVLPENVVKYIQEHKLYCGRDES